MAIEILLPMIGPAIADATVTEWLVHEGDAVVEGQPLFAAQSGAAHGQVEAPATGTLRIISRTGEPYAVGDVLGYIE